MNWILCALLGLLGFMPVFSPTLPPAPAGTVVTWLTETEHDFGEVRAGSTSKFTFRFKNAQAGPIVLQTVRTTCGCTAAEWTEAPIEPGADGEVLIEFDANRGGEFRKKITVFFDKQRKPEVLWISGEVN